MAVFKGGAICSMFLLALLGFSGAAADPCTSGELCCSQCSSECPDTLVECFGDCKSPCFTNCTPIGNDFAQQSAALACDDAKDACNVPIPAAAATTKAVPLDKRGCCLEILGSCLDLATEIGCDTPSFGTCTPEEFDERFQESIAFVCKIGSCRDEFCRDVLAGDPRCE